MSPKEIRNYRPRCWNEFIGGANRPALQRLRRELLAGEFPSAMLLISEFGYGKTSLARHLMRARACPAMNQITGDPCNRCDECRRIGPCFNGEGHQYTRFEIDCTLLLDKADMNSCLRAVSQNLRVDVFLDEFHGIAERQLAEMLLKFAEDFPDRFDGLAMVAIIEDAYHKMPKALFDRFRKVWLHLPQVDEMVGWFTGFLDRCQVRDPYRLIHEMVLRSGRSFRECYNVLAAAKENPSATLDRATLDEFLPRLATASSNNALDDDASEFE